MERFLERYSLDVARFHALLHGSAGIVSGSAALALYLEQEGVVPGYEPGDLDIWFPSGHWGSDLDTDWKQEWIAFLRTSNYQVVRDWTEQEAYMEQMTLLQQVVTLQREDKKIQLIVVDTDDLKEYIVKRFDLSICMTWWCPESGTFETFHPVLTRQKKMFIRRKGGISQGNVVREMERIQKYRERGFEVVEEPPPFSYLPDTRAMADVAVWEGIRAFDVWSYEEVEATEHLLGSDWNILVGCGTSWWAFDRRALITYMEGRRVADETGIYFDTPYRQTVVYEAWDILAYSDYSIYRLVDSAERVIRGDPKTVYSMEVYSTEGWRLGVIAERIDPATTWVRLEQDGDEEQEQEQEQEQEEEDPEEILFLLSEELGVDLAASAVPVPVSVSVSSVSMTLAEAALYQEMMEWLDQE
jgi:hypothetical protein